MHIHLLTLCETLVWIALTGYSSLLKVRARLRWPVLEGAAGTGVAGKATAELGESPHPSAPCKLCIACWVIGSEPIQTFCICVPAPPDQHSTESEPREMMDFESEFSVNSLNSCTNIAEALAALCVNSCI